MSKRKVFFHSTTYIEDDIPNARAVSMENDATPTTSFGEKNSIVKVRSVVGEYFSSRTNSFYKRILA